MNRRQRSSGKLAAWAAVLLGWVASSQSVRGADFTTFATGPGSFGSGGGTSTNGTFAASGVIGTQAPTKVSGGVWAAESGIWEAITVVQTADAPALRLVWVGGARRLRWPKQPVDWRLEVTPAVGTLSQWQPTGSPLIDAGADWEVVILPAPGHRFFRLRSP